MSCYIIAEAGVNHNGSENKAIELINAAALSGVNAVKFQTFKAATLVKRGTKKAAYQRNKNEQEDQFEMLQKLELSDSSFKHLASHCCNRNIDFLSTAFDKDSVDMLLTLGMEYLKIPSGELTNKPYIQHLASKNIRIILSTGMATLSEVAEAIAWIKEVRYCNQFQEPLIEKLTLLHCTSNYPASLDVVNLRSMQTLACEFKLPVGYSDHTAGILVPPVAVAMGAQIIEKHFTLDRKLPGPDHQASLEPDELSQMVRDIRDVELSLGDGVKKPTESEMEVREVVRRSIVLAKDVKAGHALCVNDLILLRPSGGIAPKDIHDVIGKAIKHDCLAGSLLQWNNLQ